MKFMFRALSISRQIRPICTTKITTIDLHCAGEPARVITSGIPTIAGETMAQKRQYFMDNFDGIRKLLLHEPRGYPCQNANILFPSNLDQVAFGFIILEQNKVYPMMSGHNTICVAVALLQSGLIESPPPGQNVLDFQLEAPAGKIPISAKFKNGSLISVTLRNVPSFVAHQNVIVDVPNFGKVPVDIAFGGMWYCVVDIKTLRHRFPDINLELQPRNAKNLCRIGEMIKVACREQYPVQHPEYDYPGCDILVFCGDDAGYETVTAGSHARNTVVMSNGQLDWGRPESWTGMLDRSPCGTGTCAVMANRYFKGSLPLNQDFVHESIIGTQFVGRLVGETTVGGHKAVIPEITGSAWVTQRCDIFVDPTDPFPEGYTVGDIW